MKLVQGPSLEKRDCSGNHISPMIAGQGPDWVRETPRAQGASDRTEPRSLVCREQVARERRSGAVMVPNYWDIQVGKVKKIYLLAHTKVNSK